MCVENSKSIRFIPLVLSGLMLIIIGCDELSNLSVGDITFPPPPLTNENIIDGPLDGYQYLEMEIDSMFGGSTVIDTFITQQWVYDSVGASVYFDNPIATFPETWDWWHGVVIDPDDISEDLQIEIMMPNIHYPVLDFSPHPYSFDDIVQLEFSYRYCDLQSLGFTPSDLVIMYWNQEIGIYEIITSNLIEEDEKLIVMTDHFSRYVIAVGRGSQ